MRSDIGTILSVPGWTVTSRISDAAFRTLATLILRQQSLGEHDTPTQADIAETQRVSVRQVRRCLLELETAGAIAVMEDGRDRVYVLQYRIADQTVRHPETPATSEPIAQPALSLSPPASAQGRESIVQKEVQVKGQTYTLQRTKRTQTNKRVTVVNPPDRPPVASPPIRERDTPRFNELYSLWPRQQAKEDAKRIAHALNLEHDEALYTEIRRGILRWVRHWQAPLAPIDVKFIPFLSTWLKAKRWRDKTPETEPYIGTQTRQIAAATKAFLEETTKND